MPRPYSLLSLMSSSWAFASSGKPWFWISKKKLSFPYVSIYHSMDRLAPSILSCKIYWGISPWIQALRAIMPLLYWRNKSRSARGRYNIPSVDAFDTIFTRLRYPSMVSANRMRCFKRSRLRPSGRSNRLFSVTYTSQPIIGLTPWATHSL